MHTEPIYISVVFGITTAITLYFFFAAFHFNKKAIIATAVWTLIQTVIALSGFLTVTDTIPPRMMITIVPPIILIAALFFSKSGRKFLDTANQKLLTILHTIRIPIEFVLFWLFVHEGIPMIMTFEGNNFDIISGITAPIIYYFAFINKKIGRTALIIWNVACLVLLVNIVSIALLSFPTPFRQFAHEFETLSVMYYPFNLLPAVVVPVVLLAHLTSLRELIRKAVPEIQPAV